MKSWIAAIVLVTFAFLFASYSTADSDVSIVGASEADQWVFYGFSPKCNYTPYYTPVGHVLTKPVGRPANWLTVVGYNDSTTVTVYDITGGRSDLFDSFTVDRMKTYAVELPSEGNFTTETFFKVVSSQPVAVLMSSGNLMETGVSVGGQNIFYPSTDGGFAGKEFMFLAVSSANIHARKGWDYAVFAIENSVVEVRDSDDEVLQTINIGANSSKRLNLFINKLYRVKSTGRIMISSWTSASFTACPGHVGGYAGRLFFSNPYQSALVGSPVLLITCQEEQAQVKVYDLEGGSLVIEKTLQPREMWFIKRDVADLEGVRLMIESDEEIIVYAGSTLVPEATPDSPGQIAKGITLFTVRADRPTTIFSVSDAYVFSPNGNAELRIDGLTITVPHGSYKNIPAGQITVTSNETVIIQSISDVNYFIEASTMYSRAGLRGFATYLLPADRLEFTYPPPKRSEEGPTGGSDINMMFVGAAVAIAAFAAAIFIIKKRS